MGTFDSSFVCLCTWALSPTPSLRKLMVGSRFAGRSEGSRFASPRGATRVRRASVLAVGLVFVMMLSGLIAGRASAVTCTPGWVLDSEKDNSFTWQAGGLSPDSVVW